MEVININKTLIAIILAILILVGVFYFIYTKAVFASQTYGWNHCYSDCYPKPSSSPTASPSSTPEPTINPCEIEEDENWQEDCPQPSPSETPVPQSQGFSDPQPQGNYVYTGSTPGCLPLFWYDQGSSGDGKLTLKWYTEDNSPINTVNIRYEVDGATDWQYGVTGIPYKNGQFEVGGLAPVHYWFDIVGVDAGGHGGKWYSECHGKVDPLP